MRKPRHTEPSGASSDASAPLAWTKTMRASTLSLSSDTATGDDHAPRRGHPTGSEEGRRLRERAPMLWHCSLSCGRGKSQPPCRAMPLSLSKYVAQHNRRPPSERIASTIARVILRTLKAFAE